MVGQLFFYQKTGNFDQKTIISTDLELKIQHWDTFWPCEPEILSKIDFFHKKIDNLTL